MPRRLPILPLVLAATVGLFALTSALTAQQPAAPPSGEGIKKSQEETLRMYKRFADELLKLAQRWEKSDLTEERERAKTLRAALKLAEEKGVENMFRGLIAPLANKTTSGSDLGKLIENDKALVAALREILDTLSTEDEAARLAKDIADLKELIKKLTDIKRQQENLRARTDNPRSDLDRLAKEQDRLAKDAQDLANKLAKGDPKGKPNDGGNPTPKEKDDKAELKTEGKPGDPTAEPKSDTDDPKSAGKDPMGGDPKGGDPKAEPKGATPPNAGSGKEPPKDGGEPKGVPKPMGGEPKDPMGGDAKPMPPSDSKTQGDGKGMGKPSDGKGDAKPMSGGGDSPPSPPSGSKPSGSGSPPKGGKSPPNPNNPNDDAKRLVEDAVPDQKDAEEKLKEKKKDDAGKHEDDAITKFEKALKELEKRLKQLREKEMLKKLEDLERRVAKMLQMQIEVKAATERIDQTVKKSKSEPGTAERQRAQGEADKEGLIAEEAEKALRLLEGEGTAVVFAGVLVEVKKDMEAVQKMLGHTLVGDDTQLIEQQIIDQLKQMLEALKKAKQDLENPPPPPPPGMPPPPGDQKKNLIQLIEQLKLLKSLQLQVNDRTTAFGKRTPGPQATDPLMLEQLRLLGDRQKVLQEMLHKVADQMNQP